MKLKYVYRQILESSLSKRDFQDILKATEDAAIEMVDPDWNEFTPEVCNTGFCDIFAEEFQKKFQKSEIFETQYGVNGVFGHTWVKWNGKYYDAETPHGVFDWKDLPYIQAVKNKFGKFPDDVTSL